MAVATGIPPGALLDEDIEMLEELELAQSTRWSAELELLAANVETTHALLRTYIAAHTKKGGKLPDPLRIPRPNDPDEPAAAAAKPGAVVMSPSQFATRLAGGRRG